MRWGAVAGVGEHSGRRGAWYGGAGGKQIGEDVILRSSCCWLRTLNWGTRGSHLYISSVEAVRPAQEHLLWVQSVGQRIVRTVQRHCMVFVPSAQIEVLYSGTLKDSTRQYCTFSSWWIWIYDEARATHATTWLLVHYCHAFSIATL